MDVELVIEAKAALDALAATDLDQCDRDGLDVALRWWRTVRGVSDAFEVGIARRSRRLAAEGRSECAEGVLSEHGRRASRDARAAAAREQACGAMPSFEDALAEGAVSTGHVDALAAATHDLDEQARAEFETHAETLCRHAEANSVEDFGRECRDLARVLSRDDGESRLARQRRHPRPPLPRTVPRSQRSVAPVRGVADVGPGLRRCVCRADHGCPHRRPARA